MGYSGFVFVIAIEIFLLMYHLLAKKVVNLIEEGSPLLLHLLRDNIGAINKCFSGPSGIEDG